MALSNSQYDALMRTYEQRQSDNEYTLRKHYEEVYSKIPQLKELDSAPSAAEKPNIIIIHQRIRAIRKPLTAHVTAIFVFIYTA